MLFRPAASKKYISNTPRDVLNNKHYVSIKLFHHPWHNSFTVACKESNVNAITLQINTCLFEDYYLNQSHNMLISEALTCPDGFTLIMCYYPARGWIGEIHFQSTTKPKPNLEYYLFGGVILSLANFTLK